MQYSGKWASGLPPLPLLLLACCSWCCSACGRLIATNLASLRAAASTLAVQGSMAAVRVGWGEEGSEGPMAVVRVGWGGGGRRVQRGPWL